MEKKLKEKRLYQKI